MLKRVMLLPNNKYGTELPGCQSKKKKPFGLTSFPF